MNPVRTRAASFDSGCIPLGWSGSRSAIPDRLDQVRGTNEPTLIGHSLVPLVRHNPSGLGTIPIWLHSLGMIWIRITDPRLLGSSPRNQWIHTDLACAMIKVALGLFYFGCIPWEWSGSGLMIHADYLDHGESKETWIHLLQAIRFLW